MLENLIGQNSPYKLFLNNWYDLLVLAIMLLSIILTASMLYYSLILVPLHELGHLIFAKLSGGTIISYRIMNLTFIRKNDRIKVRIYTHKGSGGQCLTCPGEYMEERHPFFLEMMGGPIIDFTVFLISLLIYLYVSFPTYLANLAFLWIAAYELISFLFNGIPMKLMGICNDGMNTLQMIRDKQAVKSWYITAGIYKQLQKGKTYKDMSGELFFLPDNANLNNDIIAYHKLNYCYYFMDLQQWNEAYEHLQDIELHGSRLENQRILSDKLFLYIKLGKSSAEIEALYKKTKRLLRQNKYDFNKIRARMAYELYKDPSEENHNRIIAEVRKIAKTYPYEGEAIFNINLIMN